MLETQEVINHEAEKKTKNPRHKIRPSIDAAHTGEMGMRDKPRVFARPLGTRIRTRGSTFQACVLDIDYHRPFRATPYLIVAVRHVLTDLLVAIVLQLTASWFASDLLESIRISCMSDPNI